MTYIIIGNIIALISSLLMVISGLVKGCPNVKDIIYYKDIKDINSVLKNI